MDSSNKNHLRQNFKITTSIKKNLSSFCPEEYFSEYPEWSEYYPEKIYNLNYFIDNYGFGKKKYIICLFYVYDIYSHKCKYMGV